MRTHLHTPVALATFALALVFSVPAPVAAQDVTYGIKGGINSATIDLSGDVEPITFDQRRGLVAGLFIAHDYNQYFGVQVEALYTQKGTRSKNFDFDRDLDVRVDYVEIPLLARVSFGKVTDDFRAHLLGGPAFAAKIDDRQKIGDATLNDEESVPVRTWDVGLAVGGAVSFKRLTIDARYTFGLINVEDDPFDDSMTIKNRAFTVTAGFRF